MRRALNHLKEADPVMRGLIEQIGPYKIEYQAADFATLVQCIVSQQLSGRVAATMYKRLSDMAGNGRLNAEDVLRLGAEKLRGLGLSRQKSAYILDLAEKTLSGEVDFDALHGMPDEEVMRLLTQVKGIGPWTVHMFLMFALQRPDVLATGDLGIRVAYQKAYALEELPQPAEIQQHARVWRPYASVACWYLWRSLEEKAGL